VRLQDEGSQLIAELAGNSTNQPNQREKILDACAAPGGKTLILAERNPTARIVACESSPSASSSCASASPLTPTESSAASPTATALTEDSVFDLALADVPCSGTGTLGRNPRFATACVRRSRPPGRAPARHSSGRLRAVRPGGRVVYSTCSLEPEENEQVVAAVLAETSNARLVSLAPRIESLRSEGILTISARNGLPAA
jgi:16S rRNA (cytosine967-C5)-methyltransferase